MRCLSCLVLLGTMNAACSDPDPALAAGDKSGGRGGGSGTSGSGGTGGTAGANATGGVGGSTGGAGGSSGAAGTASEPVECNELELEPNVPVTQWTPDPGAPPEALGGDLRDGTYFLTRITMYAAPLPEFASGRTKVVVNDASWESVEDLDDPETDATNPATTFSYTVSPVGTTATFSATCPIAESINVKYSADEDSLTLYVVDSGFTFGELFERQ